MATIDNLTAAPNRPEIAGHLASAKVLFGPWNQYAVAAVHTRGEAVQWFVWDAGAFDAYGDCPAVIRQEETLAAAVRGLVEPPLFDCTPRMAAKLQRCEKIAREQREATRKFPLGGDLTREDFRIFEFRRTEARTGYYLTLNA